MRVGSQRPVNVWEPNVEAWYDTAEDAIAFGERFGIFLDDWQKWLVRAILAETAGGFAAALQVLILIPRQNGKNGVLEVVQLYCLYVLQLPCQIHSAHLADTAAKHMARLKSVIESNPELDEITQIYEANGKEKIVNLETGGVIEFVTRTKSTKRGASPQKVYFDEALFLTDEQIQAIVPSVAAQSMDPEKMPQFVYTSSAPIPESTKLRDLRKKLPGQDRAFVAEWCAQPDKEILDDMERFLAYIYDVDNWYLANPALGIRISEDWVRDVEQVTMSPVGFAIERLGVVFGSDDDSGVLEGWSSCADSTAELASDPTLAVAVDPEQRFAAVAIAGESSTGTGYIEVVDNRHGVDWALQCVIEISQEFGIPVHLNPKSGAASLIADLTKAGVEIEFLGEQDLFRACAEFKKATKAGQFVHRNQVMLNMAVDGAATRVSGEAWAWAPRSSTVDISSLSAVTEAWWAYVSVTQDEEIEVGVW